jgi:hypothetical protein
LTDVNLKTHGTLIRNKMRPECGARGAFEELDDVRRGHDSGHAVAVKFHDELPGRGRGMASSPTLPIPGRDFIQNKIATEAQSSQR